ncbi:MAG: hypothetical protein LBI89_04140 [Prevotellaceae bacterium]|jgi:hypothetical protein|nr:hypothetical protein [Prevotellaceae bacterium]
MDNRKIINNILQTTQKTVQLLHEWQNKSMIDFEEQKTVADLLRQAISDVWTVASTDVKREKENSLLTEKLDTYKENIRKSLAAFSEQLNHLETQPAVSEKSAEKPNLKKAERKEEEKTMEKPGGAATQNDSRSPSIIDIFTAADENSSTLSTPISSLHKAIGVSDQFLFVKELFNSDANAYKATINDLDNMKNKEEAQEYLSRLFEQADGNSDAFKQFTALVNRRYMNA